MYQSLIKRFGDLIQNDCFKIATFLDPIFGPTAFPVEARNQVRNRLKYHIGLLNPELSKLNSISKLEKNTRPVSSNYTFYCEPTFKVDSFDDLDVCIDKYCHLISASSFTDTLLFWKLHENSLPLLAPLAKKFLGIPASSASVERMFNISGHVFSNKRRRTGVKLYQNLVFLKLNEMFL